MYLFYRIREMYIYEELYILHVMVTDAFGFS